MKKNKKIPRIIHYVWMGGKEKPKNIVKCMNTWKKLSNFEIIEWNESNFDIESNDFVKEAYKNKKWAFVSDYVRAWAIYNYGGIYFDTDILLIDPENFEKLLDNSAFVGYESKQLPFTAVFGAVKGHSFIKKMLDHYDNSNIDLNTTNTQWVTELLIKDYDCKLGNMEQDLASDLHVYKKEILCEPSNKSITIHAFIGSWLDNKSIFSRLCTYIRVNSNLKVFRIIYSKIIVPLKEKKNDRININSNTDI